MLLVFNSLAFLLGFVMMGNYTASAQKHKSVYGDHPLPKTVRVDRIEIFKSTNRLLIFSGSRLLKTYRVSIGRGGKGHKRYEGDGRTPEGRYRIAGRHHSRTYHRFLHISYPNAKDRRAFAEARRAKKIPAGKGIGGSIGIHGEKRGYTWLPHKWINWTLGCIAMDNDEIEELYRATIKNAVVVIYP